MYNFPDSPVPGTVYGNYVFDGTAWTRAQGSAFKTARASNLIVNPGMVISQENGNTGGTTNVYYAADQWAGYMNGIASMSSFRNPQNILPSTATYWFVLSNPTAKPSLAATDYAAIVQIIEGQRCASLLWGTASAIPIVVRFEIYTPTAGTYGIFLQNSAQNRTWTGTFITAAGSLTTIVKTIPGDTTGTWLTDNGRGIMLGITSAAGATYTAAAPGWSAGNFLGAPGQINGAATVQNILLSNVGLYPDPDSTGVPPPWTTPKYEDDLAACMRYFENGSYGFIGYQGAGSTAGGYIPYAVQKRTTPSIVANVTSVTNVTGASLGAPNSTNYSCAGTATATGVVVNVGTYKANARM